MYVYCLAYIFVNRQVLPGTHVCMCTARYRLIFLPSTGLYVLACTTRYSVKAHRNEIRIMCSVGSKDYVRKRNDKNPYFMVQDLHVVWVTVVCRV